MVGGMVSVKAVNMVTLQEGNHTGVLMLGFK